MFGNRVSLLAFFFSWINLAYFPIVVLQKYLLQVETLLFIFLFEDFVFFLVVADGLKQLGVGLLASQELHYHFFDV